MVADSINGSSVWLGTLLVGIWLAYLSLMDRPVDFFFAEASILVTESVGKALPENAILWQRKQWYN